MKDIPSGPSPKIRTPFHVPSRRGVRMVLSAQVCGLISSHSAGDSGFSPHPSASVANSPLICDLICSQGFEHHLYDVTSSIYFSTQVISPKP